MNNWKNPKEIPDNVLASWNLKLREWFGYQQHGNESQANFRLVWSEDHLEVRKMTHTKEGLVLLYPEMQQVPKYHQWVQEKYILERLQMVPAFIQDEYIHLLTYEPLWVFERLDEHGNILQPHLRVVKFLIEYVLLGQRSPDSYKKYIDPDSKPGEAIAAKEARVDLLMKELFGNESDLGDALAHKTAITVPGRRPTGGGYL